VECYYLLICLQSGSLYQYINDPSNAASYYRAAVAQDPSHIFTTAKAHLVEVCLNPPTVLLLNFQTLLALDYVDEAFTYLMYARTDKTMHCNGLI